MEIEKIVRFEDLPSIRKKYRNSCIVHCHGVFDILHYGHLLHLQSAKQYGDILVVTVTPDRYVNKGPGRPRFSEQKRSAMLAAMGTVDFVAINKYPKAVESIWALQPDFYVKGPDYCDMRKDITGAIIEEDEAVRSVGGKLVFTSDETESATNLINTFLSQWDEDQAGAIKEVKGVTSKQELLDNIDELSNMRVLVLGEPIVDTYVFCQPENLSSKSPSISAKFISKEDYAGGSLAIARHLDALGCEVTLIYTHGNEEYFNGLISRFQRDTNCKIEGISIKGIPTPRKIRYVEPFRVQRMFEIIDVRHDQWVYFDPADFIELLKKHQFLGYDAVIVSDFGHGLFEGPVLDELWNFEIYMGLNVQTNSENYGFNVFAKHKRFDYLSIDERECRLGMHDRITSIEILARKTWEKIGKPLSITLGGQGSLYFDEGGKKYFCPAFFREVIDTTGAGDAYFLITSLMNKLEIKPIAIPFIGNLYAGLKTRIIGNAGAVSKVDLMRTVNSILG